MSVETTPESTSSTVVEDQSLMDELLSKAKIKKESPGYDIARQGIHAFISELTSKSEDQRKIDKTAVDAMIAQIDKQLSAQVNQILHNESFQALESTWRSLKHLVDNVDFRENNYVEILNVTKQDLMEDFEDSPEVVQSNLYDKVYTQAYGVFGGKPYGVMCANFDFGPGAEDVELLRNCASVATMAHCPFVANAAPQFFREESFEGVPQIRDMKSLFEGPEFAAWHSFRESDDSRNVGLCMPRFLLRMPYGKNGISVKTFDFEEDSTGHHNRYLWGHSSVAFATRVADSFAKYRWCPNIIGPQAGGTVENLPLHHFEAMGETRTKIPTEIQISDRQEFELAEQGFIGLVFRKSSDNACFFSANSTQKPKFFGNTAEGKATETNFKLGTQLPYMFVITRLAHYVKVLQREQLGSWKERSDLERELNEWIRQYVSDMENPNPAVRSRRPLRSAKIEVYDVEGEPGWYRCNISVRPHFKYMGASFTLSLVGKLDKD